jgi:hypothetical protein
MRAMNLWMNVLRGPLILNTHTIGIFVVNFTSLPPYSRTRVPHSLLQRRLGGAQSHSDRLDKISITLEIEP